MDVVPELENCVVELGVNEGKGCDTRSYKVETLAGYSPGDVANDF